MIGLKVLASVVSLGSGFRGGLFFASLFLGALMGKLFVLLAALVAPQLVIDPTLRILVGMASLAVAVVGGPLTMAFLVLETTGDFAVTSVVLAAAFVTSITVKGQETFGYSPSPPGGCILRGETIRSAIDVGWMRTLTVGRMMRRDPSTIPGSATLAELRRRFPFGFDPSAWSSSARTTTIQGVPALVADAFASADKPEEDAHRTVAEHRARWKDAVLTPGMNIKEAVRAVRPRRERGSRRRRGPCRPQGDWAFDRRLRAAPLCRGAGQGPPGPRWQRAKHRFLTVAPQRLPRVGSVRMTFGPETIIEGDCLEALEAAARRAAPISSSPIRPIILPSARRRAMCGLTIPRSTRSMTIGTSSPAFEAYDDFTRAWLTECRRVLKPDARLAVGDPAVIHNIFRVGSTLQDLWASGSSTM